ncbi:MAG: branched-chain amino acid transporter AzlD [Clostridia bacterium]|nr:branched-chain amino acid transporter AzlD [Clostridia bacterium]
MQLTPIEIVVTILAVALGAMLTRFAPFILFPEHKKPPQAVLYLGRALPPAMMGLLVVYCLKSVSVQLPPHGLPELLAIALTVLMHLWKRNTLLSIGAGTALYMLLVQVVFV